MFVVVWMVVVITRPTFDTLTTNRSLVCVFLAELFVVQQTRICSMREGIWYLRLHFFCRIVFLTYLEDWYHVALGP